jgi:hypothetical protein
MSKYYNFLLDKAYKITKAFKHITAELKMITIEENKIQNLLNESLIIDKALKEKILKLKENSFGNAKLSNNARFHEKLLWRLLEKNIVVKHKISKKKQKKISDLESLQFELFTKLGLATDTALSQDNVENLQATVDKIKQEIKLQT